VWFPKKIEAKKLATQGLIKERKPGQHWCKTLEDQ
jgi:hypothetical protein